MNQIPVRPWRRAIAGFLALQLALGPLAGPAYAQVTKLDDEPIAFTPTAPPNLVLTVDDSTSMLADYLPDYVIGAVPGAAPAVGGFCRDSTGKMNVPCGYAGDPATPGHIYTFTDIPFRRYAPGSPPNATPYNVSGFVDWARAWAPPVHNAAFNRAYYDPAIDYRPPSKFDGTPYPNQTTFTSVITDPWALPAAQRFENLQANVSVGMFCNSDWPANTNWNPGSGGGQDCRINGTDYDIAGMVVRTKPDYQYPWRNTAAPTDPKHYWRTGAGTGTTWRKTIWCDTNHAKWPRTTASCPLTNCPPPQTYVPPVTQPQSCFQTGTSTGCTSTKTVYSPAGCNLDPKAGPPGGTCSGAECTPCSVSTVCTSTGVTGKTGQCRLSATGTGGSGAACNCSGASCTLPACPAFVVTAGKCSGGATPTASFCNKASANSCGLFLFDPATGLPSTTTLLADSNGAGEVCRHNNQAYATGPVAGPFGYPWGTYTTGINSTSVVNGVSCPVVPASATVPRHYWKTSVEWCKNKISNAADKWNGFGVLAPGECQDDHDLAHPYPRFYKYGVAKTDPAYLDNYLYPAFERVDLVVGASYVHTFQQNGLPVTITRTFAEEMTNYANWFAYYRTRLQAAKTVISHNFALLPEEYRVAYHTLDNPAGSYLDFKPFSKTGPSPTPREQWFNRMFGTQILRGKETPNLDAIVRIGESFRNGGHPQLTGSADPIVLRCQKNYHMLFTDGITKQTSGLPATPAVGNQDDIVGPLPQPLPLSVPLIQAGSAWPELFREDTANSYAPSLADYTTYYWITDLRPAMPDDVFKGKDPAPWQHLNFAALSLGTEGILTSASPRQTEAKIAAGLIEWPKPTPNSWTPGASGVDDLWHAAINGRGRFVNAKTSAQLGRGIAQILDDIQSPAGSDVGPSFSNPNLSVTNNYTYVAGFQQGWVGTLKKVLIDPTTAAVVGQAWSAEAALKAQVTPGAQPKPWLTNRRVVTMDAAGTPVPFLSANLSAAQLATLGPNSAARDRLIEYLRGSDENEDNDLDGMFRERTFPLGDIVHSQPVPVGGPEWQYLDGNDPGYSAFKAAFASRSKRVYVGANDGMVHAFDDANGSEAWAFIPPEFFRGLATDISGTDGLAGLSFQPGGLPTFDHRFYANATPRIVDVDFGGANWRTLLVTGLGKGGKGYYAIDVTDPASVTDEATAASKVLWKFTHPELGYSFGRPTIIKTRAHGWMVVVSSGYNNPSGQGELFFLDARTGTLVKRMGTGFFGNGTEGSGLAHFNAYVQDYRNQLAEQFYAGDLHGNLWRFDVSDPSDANWKVEKLAYLTDSGGAPQPVTIPPRIEVDIANGVDRWVFVGTGRVLHKDDLGNMQRNRMYALRDGTAAAPGPIGAPLQYTDLQAVSGVAGLGSGVIAPKGWYDDLDPGQRITTPVVATIGLVAYVASSLATDPCDSGQPANIFVRQIGNGESLLEDSTGAIVESIFVPEGGAGVEVVALYNPSCTANCIPDIRLALLTKKTEFLTLRPRLPPIGGKHRMSWRQLGQ